MKWKGIASDDVARNGVGVWFGGWCGACGVGGGVGGGRVHGGCDACVAVVVAAPKRWGGKVVEL